MGEGPFLSLRVIYKPNHRNLFFFVKTQKITDGISTTTTWGIGLTSISNKPEVRGGDGRRGNSLALENPTYQILAFYLAWKPPKSLCGGGSKDYIVLKVILVLALDLSPS